MAGRPVLTQFVLDWLARSQSPRVLHVFDRACNLVNERDEIISVVWPELGAGPFAIVLAEKRPFAHITPNAKVNITQNRLQIDSLQIDFSDAILWQPYLDWKTIQQNNSLLADVLPPLQHILRENEFNQLPPGATRRVAPMMHNQIEVGKQALLAGLQNNVFQLIEQSVKQLAGLGQGLTPTGDDFLVGAMIALWAIGDHMEVIDLIVQTAVPRTTKLSGAWLRAAGRGELVAAWRDFFAGLADGSWETAVSNILQIGHSSGYDALTGFTAVLSELIPH